MQKLLFKKMNKRNQLQKIYRKKLEKSFGGFCWLCLETGKIQFHHLRETKLTGNGRGRKERYYDILNNPECYFPICKECHDFIHHSGIDLLKIFTFL